MASYEVTLPARVPPGQDVEKVEAADYKVEDGFVHFTDQAGSKVASFQAEKVRMIRKSSASS
ncbi:hypothetical protein DEJ46_23190 [Streptomyces venezuelae]|uniref:Uncharacterized protein n=1 Tax=Streptomyces venezuelae TaxID=54571 RepID=A0A5P2AVI6_STRVZ|nr:hypothetical protein DEJ46_23190 [Streptomyces venezuelae]